MRGLVGGYGALDGRGHRLGATTEPEDRAPLVVVPDGFRHAHVEARVGTVRGGGPVHRAGRGVGEACADEARLHDRDPYAEAGDLEAEGVAQGFNGVLCGVVVPAAGEG